MSASLEFPVNFYSCSFKKRVVCGCIYQYHRFQFLIEKYQHAYYPFSFATLSYDHKSSYFSFDFVKKMLTRRSNCRKSDYSLQGWSFSRRFQKPMNQVSSSSIFLRFHNSNFIEIISFKQIECCFEKHGICEAQ